MQKLFLLPAVFFSFVIASIESTAKADEVALQACVRRQVESMGISPDLAFGECKRNSLVECIASLRSQRPTYSAVVSDSRGYLIDLGDDIKVWQEGAFWNERGCAANRDGGSITKDEYDKNYVLQRYRWFRQGWCKAESIKGAEYGEQLAYQKCDPGSYLVESKRNETDFSKSKELMRRE